MRTKILADIQICISVPISVMNFIFPIIGLSEHKIRSNSTYQVILFAMMKPRAPGFYINDKLSYVKRYR